MKFIQRNREIYLNRETLKNLFDRYSYHVDIEPFDDDSERGMITITKNIHIGNNIYLEFQYSLEYEIKDGKIIPTKNLSIDEPEGYVFCYNKNNIQNSYEEIKLFDNTRIYPQEFFDMTNNDLYWKIKNK